MNLLSKNLIRFLILLIFTLCVCVEVYGYELTDDDLTYLHKMVETEAFGASVEAKINMANVALNRYKVSNKSLKDIISSPNQFHYFRNAITQETKDAVNYALNNPDTTDGSTFFKSGKKYESFCGAEYCFTDDSGTHYYK